MFVTLKDSEEITIIHGSAVITVASRYLSNYCYPQLEVTFPSMGTRGRTRDKKLYFATEANIASTKKGKVTW